MVPISCTLISLRTLHVHVLMYMLGSQRGGLSGGLFQRHFLICVPRPGLGATSVLLDWIWGLFWPFTLDPFLANSDHQFHHRTRGNSFKLTEDRFRLDFGKKIFIVRVGRKWSRLPREAMGAQSLADSKDRWDRALNYLVEGVALKVLSKSSYSVIPHLRNHFCESPSPPSPIYF